MKTPTLYDIGKYPKLPQSLCAITQELHTSRRTGDSGITPCCRHYYAASGRSVSFTCLLYSGLFTCLRALPLCCGSQADHTAAAKASDSCSPSRSNVPNNQSADVLK